MIVPPLHFISTEQRVGKLVGGCLLHLEYYLLTPLGPLPPLLAFSGRQPTAPSERGRKQPRNAGLWSLGRDFSKQALCELKTSNLSILIVFLGKTILFDLDCKGRRESLFQARSLCCMNLISPKSYTHAIHYILGMCFRGTIPGNILLKPWYCL